MNKSSAIKGGFILIILPFLLVIAGTSTGSAHTKLLSATPEIGSQFGIWPSQLTLEFDQDLQNLGDEKANFVVVSNAVGDQVSETDEVIDRNKIQVSLSPNEITGPVLVFYHVVSSDGHPIEGEFKFTFGVGEETAEGVVAQEPNQYPIGIYLASAIFITSGLFFAIYSYRRRLSA